MHHAISFSDENFRNLLLIEGKYFTLLLNLQFSNYPIKLKLSRLNYVLASNIHIEN